MKINSVLGDLHNISATKASLTWVIHQCFLFQNEIKYVLDTLIQKTLF